TAAASREVSGMRRASDNYWTQSTDVPTTESQWNARVAHRTMQFVGYKPAEGWFSSGPAHQCAGATKKDRSGSDDFFYVTGDDFRVRMLRRSIPGDLSYGNGRQGSSHYRRGQRHWPRGGDGIGAAQGARSGAGRHGRERRTGRGRGRRDRGPQSRLSLS